MIQSFGDVGTEDIFNGINSRRARGVLPRELQRIAQRKLAMIDAARVLEDLLIPPSNHLELLRGNLKGRYSIRVNNQWRIVFKWGHNGPYDVTIQDYH